MSMPPGIAPQYPQANSGLDAMLMQWAPTFKGLADRIRPLVDQPIIRFPYNMSTSSSQTIAAGVTNQPLPQTDFSNSLEYPFEVKKIRFTQDPSHTPRDWRFQNLDLTFTMQWQKSPQGAMVETIVDANTLIWTLEFPWIVRPKGGALQPTVSNLDTVNAITVDVAFIGYLLLPRATNLGY